MVPSPELFHLPKLKLHLLNTNSLLALHPQPLETTIPQLSLRICLFWAPPISGIILVLLCLAYFIQHNVLKVHPHCSMCQNFTPFWGRTLFHCMNKPHFLMYSSVNGHLLISTFQLLWIMLPVVSAQIPAWVPVFSSFGHIPEELLSTISSPLHRKYQFYKRILKTTNL